jgi:hypothetical protein
VCENSPFAQHRPSEKSDWLDWRIYEFSRLDLTFVIIFAIALTWIRAAVQVITEKRPLVQASPDFFVLEAIRCISFGEQSHRDWQV